MLRDRKGCGRKVPLRFYYFQSCIIRFILIRCKKIPLVLLSRSVLAKKGNYCFHSDVNSSSRKMHVLQFYQ